MSNTPPTQPEAATPCTQCQGHGVALNPFTADVGECSWCHGSGAEPQPEAGDAELDNIIEGIYRWTIEMVNQGPLKERPILGTGHAPMLTPSETKAEFLDWHNRTATNLAKRMVVEARKDEADWWTTKLQQYHGYTGGGKNPFAAEINSRLDVVQHELDQLTKGNEDGN